jgi:hypothetical protein
MSWLPHDLATWLAIVALLLMYPVGLLVHFTAPRFQNWWASRSRAAMIARRDKLIDELLGLKDAPMISAGEDAILAGISVVFEFLVSCAGMLVNGVGVMLVWIFRDSRRTVVGVAAIVIFCLLWMFSVYVAAFRKLQRNRQRISQRYRDKLSAEIAELEGKIRKMPVMS